MMIMKNDYASQRAAVLIDETIAALQRMEEAPTSPVKGFRTAKRRREFRRYAARLRRGQVEPVYKNLHTAEQLAEIYEQTARRDEVFEQACGDLVRISRDLKCVVEQEGSAAAIRTFNKMLREAGLAAAFNGPDSEAGQRHRRMWFFISIGARHESEKRRQLPSEPVLPLLMKDPRTERRDELTAAVILDSPPAGQAVIPIPAEDSESGCGRVLMRIGVGNASWIGSFERGQKGPGPSTVQMMPDGKHLFVSAAGAGYIIDATSRTLVEQTGTNVVDVGRTGTVFVVNHNDTSLEAFGRSGRLWKTDAISSGGFRRLTPSDDAIIGEALRACPQGWAGFSVKLATGEVRFDDGL